MTIRIAANEDFIFLNQHDKRIAQEELGHAIALARIYIAEDNKKIAGWLRYNLFWDEIPFMNMLYILEDYRQKGHGKNLVNYWESEMKSRNYKRVMTSTASDEYAQHFYTKLGYRTIGGFLLQNEPYEIIMMKEL